MVASRSALLILQDALHKLYNGRRILDDSCEPFVVQSVKVEEADSGIYGIQFSRHTLSGEWRRHMLIDEPLPEIWPEEPMSPCS